MTDCFALLEEPRRPWLELEPLKEKFLRLSNEVHPDRVLAVTPAARTQATERYADLNAAYQRLREIKSRLAHLLDLELGCKTQEVRQVPEIFAERFLELGKLWQEADGFLSERAKLSSPLLKAQMFERSQAWTEKLVSLQGLINSQRQALEEELRGQNAAWASAPPPGSSERVARLPLERLEQVYREWSYLSRWLKQTQDRLLALSL